MAESGTCRQYRAVDTSDWAGSGTSHVRWPHPARSKMEGKQSTEPGARC